LNPAAIIVMMLELKDEHGVTVVVPVSLAYTSRGGYPWHGDHGPQAPRHASLPKEEE
jgi:hypothetical protein